MSLLKLENTASQKQLVKGLVQATDVLANRVLDTYRKEEVDAQVEVLATKEELQEAVEELQGAVGSIDLSHLATKEEVLNAVDGLASENYVDEKIEEKTAGVASQEFVLQKILEAELKDDALELELFYTKTEMDGKIDILATKEEMNANIADAIQGFEDKAMDAETIDLFNGILDKLA